MKPDANPCSVAELATATVTGTCTTLVTHNHIMMAVEGTSADHLVQPPTGAWSPREGCPGSPEETPQPLRAACSRGEALSAACTKRSLPSTSLGCVTGAKVAVSSASCCSGAHRLAACTRSESVAELSPAAPRLLRHRHATAGAIGPCLGQPAGFYTVTGLKRAGLPVAARPRGSPRPVRSLPPAPPREKPRPVPAPPRKEDDIILLHRSPTLLPRTARPRSRLHPPHGAESRPTGGFGMCVRVCVHGGAAAPRPGPAGGPRPCLTPHYVIPAPLRGAGGEASPEGSAGAGQRLRGGFRQRRARAQERGAGALRPRRKRSGGGWAGAAGGRGAAPALTPAACARSCSGSGRLCLCAARPPRSGAVRGGGGGAAAAATPAPGVPPAWHRVPAGAR